MIIVLNLLVSTVLAGLELFTNMDLYSDPGVADNLCQDYMF